MLKKQQEYQECPGAANHRMMKENQQREDQKESSSQREIVEIMESGKLKKEASEKMEAKRECNEAEKGQADRSEEENCPCICQNAGSDES